VRGSPSRLSPAGLVDLLPVLPFWLVVRGRSTFASCSCSAMCGFLKLAPLLTGDAIADQALYGEPPRGSSGLRIHHDRGHVGRRLGDDLPSATCSPTVRTHPGGDVVGGS